MSQQTPLLSKHKQLDAQLIQYAGWTLPMMYESVLKEHKAVRERAGLFDVSHMGQLMFTGPHAVSSVDGLVTRDLSKLAVGQGRYAFCCNKRGGIIDDVIVYLLSEEQVWLVCNAARTDAVYQHCLEHVEDRCRVDRLDRALLALQGPSAESMLPEARALGLPLFGAGKADINDLEVVVARSGYSGERGFELACMKDQVDVLFDDLRARGATPAGLAARDTLRLEAALPLYGQDIDESINPFEARLEWAVDLSAGSFIGKDALLKASKATPQRVRVGLKMIGRGVARHGHDVLSPAGDVIGRVTSGAPAPTLGTHIAMAYLPVAFAEVGTSLHVHVRSKQVEAKVVALPFYRRATR